MNSLATPCASLYALYWHGVGWPDWTLVDKKVTEAPFYETPSEHMDVSQKGKINFNLHLCWCIQKVSRHNMKWFTLSENSQDFINQVEPEKPFLSACFFSWHGKQSLPWFWSQHFNRCTGASGHHKGLKRKFKGIVDHQRKEMLYKSQLSNYKSYFSPTSANCIIEVHYRCLQ